MRTSSKFLLVAFLVALLPTMILADEKSDKYQTDVAAYFGDTTGVAAELVAMEIVIEDLPACFLVAKAAGTTPQTVGKLRAQGDSWAGILGSRNLDQSIFYFMLGAKFSSKVYTPLFEKFTGIPESDWDGILLTDEDVTNLVNLRFISSHHDYSMFDIMAMRDMGKLFPRINEQVAMMKKELLQKEKEKQKKAKAKEKAESEAQGDE